MSISPLAASPSGFTPPASGQAKGLPALAGAAVEGIALEPVPVTP